MLETCCVVERRASPSDSGQTVRHPSLHVLRLFFVHEVAATVLLPATFVRLSAERLLFAVAEYFDTVASHASLDERILHRIGAIGAQRQVIFGRAPLVAV